VPVASLARNIVISIPHENPPTANCFPENTPTAKCLLRKSLWKVLVPITLQLQNTFFPSKNLPTAIHSPSVGGFSVQELYSWWVTGTDLQLVGYWNKHLAVGGFSEQALSS